MAATRQYLANGGNIVLMGPPGAGKTEIGRAMAAQLNSKNIDIDDDVLEVVWNAKVSEMLKKLGDSGFVEAEGEAILRMEMPSGAVISLTGSVPLHPKAMERVISFGVILYLDVRNEDIIARLQQMKVDRIVGQGKMGLGDILNYRRGFYEKYYNVRALIPPNSTHEEVIRIALVSLERYLQGRGESPRKSYCSTRSDYEATFFEAAMKGLAPDGGLFLPKELPTFSLGELQRLLEVGESYTDVALRVLEKWIPEIEPMLLKKMIQRSYTFPENFDNEEIAPLTSIGNGQFILELFHGPTASFKDFALQLFPQIFEWTLQHQQQNQKFCILVSTSGDTGSATVHGFCKQTDIPVIVLYPKDGISPVQKAQMVTSSIKKLFNDTEWTRHLRNSFNVSLSAANSINWGRLVPQIVYHVFSYLQLVLKKEISLGDSVDCCVPTGNFGNILSALYAKKSGVPFDRLICASNENNILTDFIRTGCYDLRTRTLKKTSSPSIDILKSSNLERALHLLTEGKQKDKIRKYFEDLDKSSCKYFTVDSEILEAVQCTFWADFCTETNAVTAIEKVYQRNKFLMDPHTAVAKYVADQYLQQHPQRKVIICSTAHYSKFPTTVLQAIGIPPGFLISDQIDQLKSLAVPVTPPLHKEVAKSCAAAVLKDKLCVGDLEEIKKIVEDFLVEKFGSL